jgi:hypothetical protein
MKDGRKKLKAYKIQPYFNRAVIARDGRCVVCGADLNLQCSHYFTVGANGGLRFFPGNAYAFCAKCHLKHHTDDPSFFHRWMIEHRGPALKRIEALKGSSVRYTQAVLEQIRAYCKSGELIPLEAYLEELMEKNK